MILKSITVGNYKNLAETTIDLKRITALISVNNYGKTNLLEAIRFGFDFITASKKERQGMMKLESAIPLAPALAGRPFVFAFEFETPEHGDYRFVRYSYSFDWYSDDGSGATIIDEKIEARPKEKVRYTSYLKRTSGKFREDKSKSNFRNISLDSGTLALDIIPSISESGVASIVSNIKKARFILCEKLELDISYKAFPFEFGENDWTAAPLDDSDIPRMLHHLSEKEPERYELFLETLYTLFPEFERISLQNYQLKNEVRAQIEQTLPHGEQDDVTPVPFHIKNDLFKLMIKSAYLNQPLSMELMSTGTKRIFWLVANAVFSELCGIGLLGVDEVETSVHPRMMEQLLSSMNEILKDASMIISSHSPYVIQYLKPDAIYIGVPNNDGVARFARICSNKTKSLLKKARGLKTSIGELLFEYMAGDADSTAELRTFLEES